MFFNFVLYRKPHKSFIGKYVSYEFSHLQTIISSFQRQTTGSPAPRRLPLTSLVSSTPIPSEKTRFWHSHHPNTNLAGTLTLTTVPSSTSAWTESPPASRAANSDSSTTNSPSSATPQRTSQSGKSIHPPTKCARPPMMIWSLLMRNMLHIIAMHWWSWPFESMHFIICNVSNFFEAFPFAEILTTFLASV